MGGIGLVILCGSHERESGYGMCVVVGMVGFGKWRDGSEEKRDGLLCGF